MDPTQCVLSERLGTYRGDGDLRHRGQRITKHTGQKRREGDATRTP